MTVRVHCFFSVHEQMFHGIFGRLQQRGPISSCSGFCWGQQQVLALQHAPGPTYDPLIVFSRDVLPYVPAQPDISFLQRKERELDFSLNRILLSERHLLRNRNFDQRLALLETLIRTLETNFQARRPDVLITEDVSCMTSYLHWALARRYDVPFLAIGQGKLDKTVAVYRDSATQRWDQLDLEFATTSHLDDAARSKSAAYIARVRATPTRPPTAKVFAKRPTLSIGELGRLVTLARAEWVDSDNPTVVPPLRAIGNRLRRVAFEYRSERLFKRSPTSDQSYVVFPLQVEPEASTLVRGFMVQDQVELISDIARALPIGVKLYVKEHYASVGRRPPRAYRQILAQHGVELLHPDVPLAPLLQHALAVVTITSTMGWEGIIHRLPVFTFGDVFYNSYPGVTSLSSIPKDRWQGTIRDVLQRHKHDEEVLIRYIAAAQRALRPGFKANPRTFPDVLEPANLDHLANAVASRLKDLPPIDQDLTTRS